MSGPGDSEAHGAPKVQVDPALAGAWRRRGVRNLASWGGNGGEPALSQKGENIWILDPSIGYHSTGENHQEIKTKE